MTEEDVRRIIREELGQLIKPERFTIYKTMEFLDGRNIQLPTTTGVKLGTASTQKLGFFGATPVVKQTAPTAAETTITHTTPSANDYALQDVINSNAWGWASHDEANTTLAVIKNLQIRMAEIITKLQSLGLLS